MIQATTTATTTMTTTTTTTTTWIQTIMVMVVISLNYWNFMNICDRGCEITRHPQRLPMGHFDEWNNGDSTLDFGGAVLHFQTNPNKFYDHMDAANLILGIFHFRVPHCACAIVKTLAKEIHSRGSYCPFFRNRSQLQRNPTCGYQLSHYNDGWDH